MPDINNSPSLPEEPSHDGNDFAEASSPLSNNLDAEELIHFIIESSNEYNGRVAALSQLLPNPKPSTLMALCEHLLQHPEDTIKQTVVDIFSEVPSSEVILKLCLAAQDYSTPLVQKAAVDILSRMQDKVAEEFLKDFLNKIVERPAKYTKSQIKRDDELTERIVGNISFHGSKEMVIFIAQEIFPKYPTDDLRPYIALNIPATKYKECTEVLLKALDDKNFAVQLCAQTNLLSSDDEDIKEQVMRKLFS